jgi:5-methylcytosine-specific restriction protein A
MLETVMPKKAPTFAQFRDKRYPVKRRRQAGPSSAKRGYDRRWRKLRAMHLVSEPLCRTCLANGKPVGANVVDHIIPHEGQADPLFWDPENLQSLCVRCHNRKTAREDGGFGNVKKA